MLASRACERGLQFCLWVLQVTRSLTPVLWLGSGPTGTASSRALRALRPACSHPLSLEHRVQLFVCHHLLCPHSASLGSAVSMGGSGRLGAEGDAREPTAGALTGRWHLGMRGWDAVDRCPVRQADPCQPAFSSTGRPVRSTPYPRHHPLTPGPVTHSQPRSKILNGKFQKGAIPQHDEISHGPTRSCPGHESSLVPLRSLHARVWPIAHSTAGSAPSLPGAAPWSLCSVNLSY